MNIGTKSLLFGVHQFLWHPLTVLLAWKKLYGNWPAWPYWIAIFFHDWGYWGCPNMDGPEGKNHPARGAEIVRDWVYWIQKSIFALQGRNDLSSEVASIVTAEAYWLVSRLHSAHYARLMGLEPSSLYLPDKASILFEPRWFYLLRARLTGELQEYVDNSPRLFWRSKDWFDWYRARVVNKVTMFFATRD